MEMTVTVILCPSHHRVLGLHDLIFMFCGPQIGRTFASGGSYWELWPLQDLKNEISDSHFFSRFLGWWYLDKTLKLQWCYNGLRHMEMLGLGGYILHKKGCESLGARGWTIVGWTVASKFVQVSIPWICEYVTLYGRRDFEDMNKLRILKWGDFLELSRWARYSQGSS